MRYALVLGHLMRRDGQLSIPSKKRVEMGASLMRSGKVDLIIFSGAAYRSDTARTLASAMRDFAIFHCFADPKRIKIDTNARDTVGDAIFLRRRLETLRDYSKSEEIYVISSEYHANRVAKIFNFVFGKGAPLRFLSVESPFGFLHVRREAESLNAFYQTFAGIDAGDLESIELRLVTHHPLYSKAL